MKIRAVIFDLDDTLYPEYDYVVSGFTSVSTEIENLFGVNNSRQDLLRLFAEDKQNVFNRYLEESNIGYSNADVLRLIEIYREHKPNISLSHEVKSTLRALHNSGYRLGIITDGRVEQQRKKIEALQLDTLVDKIIITDGLGGTQYRKPNPTSFKKMAEYFNIFINEMVYVGDNPNKDFAIKKYLPVATVRLSNNGLYKDGSYLENILPDKTINIFSDIITVVGEI